MPTSAERKVQAQLERDALITQNRAKFSQNRIVYVTPNGMHVAHDIADINGLTEQLRADGFEPRSTTQREAFFTTDWFKHGEGDWWESYVITKR